MNATLENQRAVVTAGGSGIGRTIARHLIEAGAQCMICDVDDQAVQDYAAEFGEGMAVHADVSDPDQVATLFKQAEQQLGGLDILVNNAGVSGPTAPLEQLALADWQHTIAVNLDGHFLCSRAAIPLLRAAGGGSMVNMSSIGGRLGYPNRSAYAAAKWGIVGLTKTLSMELGPEGIRVNVIQPGMVAGPRVERVMREKAAERNMSYEDFCTMAYQGISLRRPVVADDIAALIVFLASPLGQNISGQAIPVDGDATRLS